MSDRTFGKRVLGHRLAGEPWYECAITGLEFPESETVVPKPPHPQAYRRVWIHAFDQEMTHSWYKTYFPPVIGDDDRNNV
jgi:hypothetical protein